MKRNLYAFYSLAAYFTFLISILYLIGFLGNSILPKTVDSPAAQETSVHDLITDVTLILIFAIQHSWMARKSFKLRWKKLVPEPIERSTYVLFSSFILLFLFWQWRPVPLLVWSIKSIWAVSILWMFYFLGWSIVIYSSTLISHTQLIGLQKPALQQESLRGSPRFTVRSLYKLVRHPLMVGLIISFWSAPEMTLGHLVFSSTMTVYILAGIRFEEADLISEYGEDYAEYQRRVGKIFPKLR